MAGKQKVVWSLLLAAAAGCAKAGESSLPVPAIDDAGLPSRVVTDVAVPVDGTSAAPGEDAGSGPVADASLLKGTVEIVTPLKDDGRAAPEPFPPPVNVVIDSSKASRPVPTARVAR